MTTGATSALAKQSASNGGGGGGVKLRLTMAAKGVKKQLKHKSRLCRLQKRKYKTRKLF